MHHLVLPGAALFVRAGIRRNRLCAFSEPIFREDDGLTETADYCAAARIGMRAFKKRRTRSIVRCLSASGSFHG